MSEVLHSYEWALAELWWLRPLLDPGLLLACAGGLLLGFLVYVDIDQGSDRLQDAVEQRFGPAEPRQPLEELLRQQRRRFTHSMLVGIIVVSLLGVFVAILGLWFTGTVSVDNFAIALLVVGIGTIVLLAPIYALTYLYQTWKWRPARLKNGP
jgi:type IV secretory pathway VirB6-like protein